MQLKHFLFISNKNLINKWQRKMLWILLFQCLSAHRTFHGIMTRKIPKNFLRAYNKTKSWLRPLKVCSLWQGIHCPYAVLELSTSWQLPKLMTSQLMEEGWPSPRFVHTPKTKTHLQNVQLRMFLCAVVINGECLENEEPLPPKKNYGESPVISSAHKKKTSLFIYLFIYFLSFGPDNNFWKRNCV